MTDNQISDIWCFFKEFIGKDDIQAAAEQFVDLLADFNIKDKVLQGAMGADADLDSAIEYYLEDDTEIDEEYEDSEEDDY
jgi:hypothetical protein